MSDQYSLEDREELVRLKDGWERTLLRLEDDFPETVTRKFLRPLVPAGLAPGIAVLEAPGQFVQEWVREKYLGRLTDALSDELGEPIRIELRIGKGMKPAPRAAQGVVIQQPMTVETPNAFVPQERYRFDTFVVGQSNRLAFAGAKAVAAAPGHKYNPLFIYGPIGLGKTHLLHAIAHELLRFDRSAAIGYVSAQQFAEEFVHALQNNRIDHFRRAQRSADIWLLDDVQFIAGKDRTQEEVFHTFNYLHTLGKQIVLCSDRPPRDLMLMQERLRSRFEAGLVVDVQMPDTETRCAIVLKKAEQDRLKIATEVAMYLAENIPSNVRILEGALTKLAAQSSLEGVPIDLDLAKSIIEKYYQTVGLIKPSFDQILDAVSKHTRIPVSDIKGISRKAPIAHARHVAVYVTREITRDSWKHIGALFGNRDHTSMMHGYKKIRDLMNRDRELNASVRLLLRDLHPEA